MVNSADLESEPTTPAWLPVVGVVLFLAFGAWLAIAPTAASAPVAAEAATH